MRWNSCRAGSRHLVGCEHQADTLWKRYTPDWDLHQLRHTAISLRAAHDYTEVDFKRLSGHSSLRSLERSIADSREAAKRKAREWERLPSLRLPLRASHPQKVEGPKKC
jgi:integrase